METCSESHCTSQLAEGDPDSVVFFVTPEGPDDPPALGSPSSDAWRDEDPPLTHGFYVDVELHHERRRATDFTGPDRLDVDLSMDGSSLLAETLEPDYSSTSQEHPRRCGYCYFSEELVTWSP
jgi:hypothetical protein